jgi:NaMN:DMB phosphoribosyltransferase
MKGYIQVYTGKGKTTAALAIGVVDAAVHVFNEMLTFEEAGVADKN